MQEITNNVKLFRRNLVSAQVRNSMHSQKLILQVAMLILMEIVSKSLGQSHLRKKDQLLGRCSLTKAQERKKLSRVYTPNLSVI